MPITVPAIDPAELENLASPCLVIFQDRLLHNMDLMLKIAGSPQRLRPHCKTHKMEQIIRLWVERGVTKHKAATIAECEMLALAGATDVLFAYNPVGPNIARLVTLALDFPECRFSCTADSEKPLRQLSEMATQAGTTIGVFLDVNVGMERTGIAPSMRQGVELYALAGTLSGIRPGGFHVYDGHRREMSPADRKAAVAAAWPLVTKLRSECEAAGAEVPVLACGGTPTFPCYAEMTDPAIELCPGTSVLHDAGYAIHFPDLPFSPAAAVVTRVVSRPASNRMTLDIGNKAVAADPPKGARIYLPDLPDAVQDLHSEEHMGLITESADRYEPGDVLMAIPMHICPTAALYDQVAVIDGGRIVDYWEVTSRNRKLTV